MAEADAQNFPEPGIGRIPRTNIRKRYIFGLSESYDVGVLDRKVVMESSFNNFFEIGRKLNSSNYGSVVHGILVVPTEVIHDNETVYERTDCEVAMKVSSKKEYRKLTGRTEEDPLNEISALQFIGNGNPNIICMLECCEDEDHIYLIMPCYSGGELISFIHSFGVFNESRARGMMKQLLNALQHLQYLGIGHRDFSCENILFDETRELFVLIDFGMCRRCHLKEATIANPPAVIDASCYRPLARLPICGKQNYVAPEVFRGEATFNPMLCDIWALGIILFIALTGIPPVDAALESDERYRMIAEGRLHVLTECWNMDLSHEVLDLIQHILRPDPNQRLSISQILAHPWMNKQD
mmetsp:Transcript_5599/g.8319  ORF Transcript_5599/g.8319 Transcript_5599/m.8319 type:complete len:354 (-) Transcript_5599:92-1153(-)